MDKNFKSGFVAIVGKPNVGKSTLLNKILKQKISIVSPKPQTTRNKITGIYNTDDCQIVFLDTPGIHKAKNTLDKFMEKSISSALEGIDCLVYMLDGLKNFDDEEIKQIENYSKTNIPVILVVNKTDESSYEKLYPKLAKLNSLSLVKEIIPISAKVGNNVDVLLENILKFIPNGPCYYPQDISSDKTEQFIVGEIIREKALWLLNEEIPHGVAVLINSFKEQLNIVKIDATIICEKESHKSIIIGANGSKLKKIAENSRKDMEKLLGKQVYLSIWVKVKENWRDNDFQVSNLGYNIKNID